MDEFVRIMRLKIMILSFLKSRMLFIMC